MATKKVVKKAVKKLGAVKAPKKVKGLDYFLEVSFNDVVYKVEAVDFKQALKDFVGSSEFPFAFKTRVLVKYGKGSEERSQFYHVPEARKVFKMVSLKESALELLASKLEANLLA